MDDYNLDTRWKDNYFNSQRWQDA